jgi:hypothetical protein
MAPRLEPFRYGDPLSGKPVRARYVEEPYIGAPHPHPIDARSVANQTLGAQAWVVLPLDVGGRVCTSWPREEETSVKSLPRPPPQRLRAPRALAVSYIGRDEAERAAHVRRPDRCASASGAGSSGRCERARPFHNQGLCVVWRNRLDPQKLARLGIVAVHNIRAGRIDAIEDGAMIAPLGRA